jgi:hypothetical protein
MDDVQNVNNYINISLSRNFKSHEQRWFITYNGSVLQLQFVQTRAGRRVRFTSCSQASTQ